MNSNKISYLPESIGRLSNLKRLNLAVNSLSILPDSFGNLKEVEHLSMKNNYLETLPECIGNLRNLKSLNLNSNMIVHLPESFGKLTNLFKLNMGSNRLKILPLSFCNLNRLTNLILNNNEIESLLTNFGNLRLLKNLNLNNNLLKALPSTFCNLVSLERLSVDSNKLEFLSTSFGDLKSLTRLNLSHNKITQIPDSFSNLSKLQILHLDNNTISSLPLEFGNLSNLKVLLLDKNQFSIFPDSLGNLKNLEKFYGVNNQIKYLPNGFRNLGHLRKLVIYRNTTLVKYGIEDKLGAFEIEQIYKDNAIIDPICISKCYSSEKEVYEDLEKEILSWNFKVLKSIRFGKIKHCNLKEKEMICILQKLKFLNIISEEQCYDLVKYVGMLFNPSMEYQRFRMNRDYIPMTKSFLGDILEYLNEKIESDDLSSINISLGDIAESVKYCAVRQITELRRAYLQCFEYRNLKTKAFIYQFIANLKEQMFDMTIMKFYSNNDSNFLNYMKMKFSEILGFDYKFKNSTYSNIERKNEEEFLMYFYSKFTPRYVIAALKENINQSEEMKNDLINIIDKDRKLSYYDKLSMISNFKESDFIDKSTVKLSEKGIEYIVLKMNIIKNRNRALKNIEWKKIIIFIVLIIIMIGSTYAHEVNK